MNISIGLSVWPGVGIWHDKQSLVLMFDKFVSD